MIFPDFMINDWAQAGGIEPYESKNVNPGSIDLRLGNGFIDLSTGREFEANEITIIPGDAILATTLECIKMLDDAVGTVYLKSTLARQGLDHALAGFTDCGFCGQLTLELHAHRPITIKAGQPIIQLVLHQMIMLPDRGYNGKYQNQRGPTRAR